MIEPCPYLIECAYSDDGSEYKGTAHHAFVVVCFENGVNQKFTQPTRPQTNGQAEQVIRTLMEIWHHKRVLIDSEHRQQERCRFVNFYHTTKLHSVLNGDTLFEVLWDYFSQTVV